jgi:hypothetical protein
MQTWGRARETVFGWSQALAIPHLTEHASSRPGDDTVRSYARNFQFSGRAAARLKVVER